MNDFKAIYKILKALRDAMDDGEDIDLSALDPERLGISQNRRDALLAMLVDEGYVTGVYAPQYRDRPNRTVHLMRPAITLSGLQYLQENSMMRKVAEVAKGVVDVLA